MDSSKDTRSRILEGFGVNGVILGQVEGANRASSVAAEVNFLSATVNPLIRLISELLTKYVVSRFDDGLTLWIEPARPDDPDSDRSDRQQLIDAGALTVNELRAVHHLEPLPDGNRLAGKKDAARLRKIVKSLAARVAAQSEVISRRAERNGAH